ncbi:MAG TPA: FAD-binding oxidoreductase [Nitrospiraceae bacterium]|nr:FAD-binding oxidoreductase [Nitrospiraceae bacterium]
MITRRVFFKLAGVAALMPWGCARWHAEPASALLNDVHSRLNPTTVRDVISVRSVQDIQRTIERAMREERGVSVAGGRHAMGGQQFGTDTLHLDMRPFNRVLNFDSGSGLVEVEAGIQWPELIEATLKLQQGAQQQWGIVQKQTGADRLSIGGGLSANIHGRGLKLKPFVGDIESFTLVSADEQVMMCSRLQNPNLFKLAIGGYGLVGVVSSVTLRLMPRQKLQRVVELVQIDDVMQRFEQRIADGFLYGDCQFALDPASEDFLRRGIFSCYRSVDPAMPIPARQREIAQEQWLRLLYLAHTDKTQAFDVYSKEYLATNGQIYWSDTHQTSYYPDGYHRSLDSEMRYEVPGSEMISELYVPRRELAAFFADMREDFRKHNVEAIYGTIRLIERDDESFLAWAREPWACTVLNLHVSHTPAGIERAAAAFRRLIDLARKRGGSYFLTYHKWATRAQVEACYPQFSEFLRLKRKYDPQERFQSDWYRHYRTMFADRL